MPVAACYQSIGSLDLADVHPEIRECLMDSSLVALLDQAAHARCRHVAKLAQIAGMPRKALSEKFREAGLPPTYKWLVLLRAINAVHAVNGDRTVRAMAAHADAPDQFTFSNQVLRHFGCRPTQLMRMSDAEIVRRWWERAQ